MLSPKHMRKQKKVPNNMNPNTQKIKKPCICFVAGCSGGHIIPCLTLAQQEREKNPDMRVLFFTTNRTLDKKILANTPSVTHHIPLPLASASYGILKFPLFIWHLKRSFFTSLCQLQKHRPAYVLTTGSHIAIPVCLAAWVLRIPVKLFEVNALPGKTTKLLAHFTQEIFVCYTQNQQYFPAQKCIFSRYPVKFTEHEKQLSREQALRIIAQFHDTTPLPTPLTPDQKTILVLGGSQGSLFLNQLTKKILELDIPLRKYVQIIHQTGDLDTTNWQEFYAQHGIPALVFAYRNQMAPYYAAADLILCRAGAGTLAELIFFGKKSIVIPLETQATDHQLDNAQAAAEKHPELICVMRQNELETDTQKLVSTITRLLA